MVENESGEDILLRHGKFCGFLKRFFQGLCHIDAPSRAVWAGPPSTRAWWLPSRLANIVALLMI
jgi:hypothetical protein